MSTNNDVPFLDLITPHIELEQELTAIFQRVLRTAGFIGGPMVEEFESRFAEFCTTARRRCRSTFFAAHAKSSAAISTRAMA